MSILFCVIKLNALRLHDGCNSGLLQPHLASIFQFLEVTSQDSKDESIAKNSIGLIGDLAVLFSQHSDQVKVCVDMIDRNDWHHLQLWIIGFTLFPSGLCRWVVLLRRPCTPRAEGLAGPTPSKGAGEQVQYTRIVD